MVFNFGFFFMNIIVFIIDLIFFWIFVYCGLVNEVEVFLVEFNVILLVYNE